MDIQLTDDRAARVTDRSHKGKAWIARITGTHSRYGLDRDFCDADDVTEAKSNTYRTQEWTLPLDEGAVYEYRDLGASSSGGDSGFWQVQGGELAEISEEDAEAHAESEGEHAEADEEAGPQVYLRPLSAHDSEAEADEARAELIRAKADLEWAEYTDSPTSTGESPCEARQRISDAESALRSAENSDARPRRLEIVVTESYEVKDILKERGYRFGRDHMVTGDLLRGEAGWSKTVTAGDAEAELDWILAQGWQVHEPAGPVGSIFGALAEGRPELLDGTGSNAEAQGDSDPIAEAEAYAEDVREQIERSRQQKKEREAEKASLDEIASGFEVASAEKDGGMVRVTAEDGTEATGYEMDGEVFISQLDGREYHGTEGDRIAEEAAALLEE